MSLREARLKPSTSLFRLIRQTPNDRGRAVNDPGPVRTPLLLTFLFNFQTLALVVFCWYFPHFAASPTEGKGSFSWKTQCRPVDIGPWVCAAPLSRFYLVKEWVYPAGLALISRRCPTGAGETGTVGRKVVMFHKRDSHGVKPRHCYNRLLFASVSYIPRPPPARRSITQICCLASHRGF